MAKMSELWEKMNQGDRVQVVSDNGCLGDIATKDFSALIWEDNPDLRVSTQAVLNLDWQLVEEEEKEIETEKWMRCDDGIHILYKPPYGFVERLIINTEGSVGIGTSSPSAKLHINQSPTYKPSEIMDRKNFLRWVGTTPSGEKWHGSDWCRWYLGNDDDAWTSYCDENRGYTNRIVADYAEMRVEK